MSDNKRTEHDFIGELEIPNDVYYGVQTYRAMENFPITGIPISTSRTLVRGLGYVKKAAAMANRDLGVIDPKVAEAIILASEAVIRGELNDQFTVDMIQGGAGTSTNMNANEVIANKALEIMGYEKGRYDVVHPNNHVNFSQSTNDAYPTAFRVALHEKMDLLIESMERLRESFAKKGEEFQGILKMGRTQLQDAVPMTLGQEFTAFAVTIGEDIRRIKEAQALLTEVNLGATAIGTTINAPEGYPELATQHLREVTGIPVTLAENLVEATSDTGAYVQISGVFKRVAVKISKICNDLRLLSSGPRAGLNEINLPKMQPGSSIMPGKVNPVIPEVVNQIAYQVIGADVTITMAAEAGQLQLNVMEPVIAYNLFNNIKIMINGFDVLATKCVEGITANAERCAEMVMGSIGIVTALNPLLGYETSAGIAKQALLSGASVYDIVLEKNLLSKEKLDEILSVENLMNPRFIKD
ncbi:aspartate ammonia-lyase [Fulvitalea axinellae]|uniref:Aspartate ammonia-lyase n=1 Tax=Fulvitalea axinellae TaxID=1182444 RepID=A0AAU9CTC0_9BACT|nr:aspartate ammonia-lyase [Fulvitalea axinellae]